jgi:UDP-N-acetylmuramoyl-tripeptide--D-alanyl-D-alanine ligase
MRYILQFILKILARATIAKYKPRIVGITGSVGKTSTKEAVVAVLATNWRVGQTSKNLNNEIGLPLVILGEKDSGYSSLIAWLKIFSRALKQLLITNVSYPEFLVLEYGVDKEGDIDYLLSITRPEVAVITAVTPTHLELLGSVEAVGREKSKLVTNLPPQGIAVLNLDDDWLANLSNKIKTRLVTFGFSQTAQVRADNWALSKDENNLVVGISFKLISNGSSVPIFLPGIVGKPPVLVALAATAVGITLGVPVLEIAQALQSMTLLPGRLRLIAGINNTSLIDDTYNSSPSAAREAIDVLSRFPLLVGARRWAVLGDMLELGKESDKLHREIGKLVAEKKIDFLITVGKESRAIASSATLNGLQPENTWHFTDSSDVGHFVKQRLQTGDVILIKGSQGVRCERITKELMTEPELAKELLVRQYKPWI